MIQLHCPNINQELIIKDYEINPIKVKFLVICNNDTEYIYQLQRILDDIDCSVFLKCGKIISVNTPKYDEYLSLYMYYAGKIQDQVLYNEYIDKLIARHEANVKHDEVYFKVNPDAQKDKEHPVKKKGYKPIWTREKSIDLFENDFHYIYTNRKTGEIIHSNDPDLIAKGLGKKKREVHIDGIKIANHQGRKVKTGQMVLKNGRVLTKSDIKFVIHK